MQAWRLLQLEPSSLREPDSFTAPADLGVDGAHLPAALYRLANQTEKSGRDQAAVYSEVANRVSQLINDVRSVYVDRDERRQLLTAYVKGRDGTSYPARSLSDGTLRFLALSVLSLDPDPRGIICMEEPENGIHPERIPAMIQLLNDLTTDVNETEFSDKANSIRQVIINTHSPAVVMQVQDESLLVAELINVTRDDRSFRGLQLRCLHGTWRDIQHVADPVSRGQLLAYLNPVSLPEKDDAKVGAYIGHENGEAAVRRVVDREDIRQYKIPFAEIAA
jgi:predicted ATPase